MPLLRIVGVALLGLAAWQALRMYSLDREMQRYRAPGASPAAYLFIPVRWQRRLYTGEGQALVGRAWRTLLGMYGRGLLARLLLALGGA